ncbi:MAG: D-aminoacyl-tRNA deacylase [Christensenellales bacterium]|jgi:D-tyrosyl-tRNA(Tyr) deacylase
MRCVIQRVLSAEISVSGEIIASIGKGLAVLVGFNSFDSEECIPDIVNKLINLRIFDDENNKLNLSVQDIGGEILLAPNFTLYGDASKGRRPDFTASMKADKAELIFADTVKQLKSAYDKCKFGIFKANMRISLINDGPLTIIYEK